MNRLLCRQIHLAETHPHRHTIEQSTASEITFSTMDIINPTKSVTAHQTLVKGYSYIPLGFTYRLRKQDPRDHLKKFAYVI